MPRRIQSLVIPIAACLVALGCADEFEGEPPPSCLDRPELCPDPADGGPARGAIAGDVTTPLPEPEPPVPEPPPVESCPGDSVECDGVCVDPQIDPLHCGGCGRECTIDQECRLGQCCALSDVLCDGACTDVTTDDDHCGTCGLECMPGLECVIGICTPVAGS